MSAIPGLEEMLAKRRAVVDSVSITAVGSRKHKGVSFGEDPATRLKAELQTKLGCRDFKQRSRTGFAGLVNQGATCYLNSLLQTWYMTPELRRALYSWRYNPDIHGEAKRCVPYQLQRLFARLQLSRASVAATRDLTRSFGFDSMDGFRQQDVMECMAVFIEFLANIGVGTPLGDHVTTEQTGEMEAYLSFTADGQEYCHARDESFRAVTVAVNGMPTIEAALAAHISPTEISGYFADEVQRKVDALKGERFKTLPKILTLHLGRYIFDMTTFDRRKTQDPVKIGETLDMTPFTAAKGGDQECEYELISAMIHRGSAHSGHYYALVKDVTTGDWFKFNDSHVTRIDHDDMLAALGQERAAPEELPVEGEAAAGDAAAKDAGTGAGGAGAGAADTKKPKKSPSVAGASAAKFAYMLVYRRKDAGRADPIPADAVPKELRDEVEAENVEYDQLYAKWKHEQEMCRLRVFHGGENCLVVLHQGKTVREALESAHAQLVAASSGDGDGDGDGGGASPETVPLSCCRLRQFDYLKGIAGRPIEDLDASLLDAGVTTRSSLKLETRAEGEEFSSWAEGGLDLLLVHLPADADSFDFPVQINFVGETVGDLRLAAKMRFGFEHQAKLVWMTDTTMELDDDTVLVGETGLKLKPGTTIHVEPWDGTSESRIVARFDKVLNEVSVKYNLLDCEVPKGPKNPLATRSIVFDGRRSLEELKAALAEVLGVPVSEFKLMKDYHRGPEIKDLSKSLEWAGLAGDEATLYLKPGQPMLPTQVSLKVYLYAPLYEDAVHIHVGDESKDNAATPAADAAEPPQPPAAAAAAAAAAASAKNPVHQAAAAALAAAQTRTAEQAAASAAEAKAKAKTAAELKSLGTIIVDRDSTCDELRAAIDAKFAGAEGMPTSDLMRLRARVGKRPGDVFKETKTLAKNAHPLRDGRGVVVQPTLVVERFGEDHILLETRCWHPDTTVLEATKEIAVDKNLTVRAVKELLSTLCNGAVSADNMVLARAQRFHTKKLTSMPKLLWKQQPSDMDTIGDCDLRVRHGSLIVYKDRNVEEILAPKPRPLPEAGPGGHGTRRTRQETAFRIYTPEEQLERERKRKEEKERKKKLLEEAALASKQASTAAAGAAVDDDRYAKYTRMIKVGVPLDKVKEAMTVAGLNFSDLGIDHLLDGSAKPTPTPQAAAGADDAGSAP